MTYPTSIVSNRVAEIFAVASSTGIIKGSEYRQLIVALNQPLDDRDRKAVERLLRFVRKGRIELVDDMQYNTIPLRSATANAA